MMAYNVWRTARGDESVDLAEQPRIAAAPELRAAINPAEWQIFQSFQPYIYVQSGTAVGMFGYPLIPDGIWPPAFQLEPVRPRYGGARKQGPIPQEYVISWEYKFGSTRPLIGVPHTLQG